MKGMYCLIFLLISFTNIAQTTIQYLDINQVKVGILNRGDMFWNPDSQKSTYEYPKGSLKTSNFVAALWVSGINQNTNDIHLAAQTYRQSGNDFWPGPIDNNGNIDSLTSDKWDKIWKVDKITIDNFINSSPHTLANTSAPILEWPAKGNIYAKGKNGNALNITKNLAPFVDANNDGIYNALDGDYPKIKGEQALWWVFNDVRPHTQTGSNIIGLEIIGMAYACNSINALQSTVFVNFHIKNTSTSNYENTSISLFNDCNLGNFSDDYIGIDTIRRMAISYNGDNDDGYGFPNEYGAQLTQTGTILTKSPNDINGMKEPLGGFTYHINDLSPMGNPYNPAEFYNYMHNLWRDGMPYTNSCNARYPGAIVKYVYPSEPNDLLGWSEKQCNNTPLDRRFVLNSTSFTMNAGSEYDFNFAVMNTPLDSLNNDFTSLKSIADTVLQYADGCANSFPLSIKNTETEMIQLFPNPTSQFIEIKENTSFLNSIQTVEIISVDGNTVYRNSFLSNNNKIDVQWLKNGMYFIKLYTNLKVLTSRFFKN